MAVYQYYHLRLWSRWEIEMDIKLSEIEVHARFQHLNFDWTGYFLFVVTGSTKALATMEEFEIHFCVS